MKITSAVAMIAALVSTQALAQTKVNKTLVEANAYTDQAVAAEAKDRAAFDNQEAKIREQVDASLQSQIDGLAGNPGADPPWVVRVAKSGGDFTTVSAALASITDASAAKRYEIRVDAGVYLEPQGITLKNHVDIVGSGANRTTITAPLLEDLEGTLYTSGIVNAEVRDLKIVNTGGNIDLGFGASPVALGIWLAHTEGHVRFVDVAVLASIANAALTYTVVTDPYTTGAISFERSVITAGDAPAGDSFGVYTRGGSVMLRDVDVNAGLAAVVAQERTRVVIALSSTLTARAGGINGYAAIGAVQLVGVVGIGQVDGVVKCGGVVLNGVGLDKSCN